MKGLYVATIATTLVLLCGIQFCYGGAVMSVDLGSEWIKVNH